jgi:NTP pyrophosphatase (non-canonical NTP hydrolase)
MQQKNLVYQKRIAMVGVRKRKSLMSDPTHPEARPVSHQYELAVLGEECGEAIQIVGKTLRFGYESYNPSDKDKETNLDLLHKELGDVLAAIDFAVERGLLDREKLVTRQFFKRKILMKVAPPPAMLLQQVAAEPSYMGSSHLGSSSPALPPTPEPGVVDPMRRTRIVVGIVAAVVAVVILGSAYMFSQANAELNDLRAYDECITANAAKPSACDELAEAVGEERMGSIRQPLPDAASDDNVIAGSR